MSQELSGEHFLHHNNPRLHVSEEVDHVVRYLSNNGERIPNRPVDRIQAYLGFLAHSELVNDGMITGDADSMSRQVEYHVIKPEDVPESYFKLQQRILYEQGYGQVELSDEHKEQMIASIRADQTERLSAWGHYLTDESNSYDDWFKYYVMHNVTSLSQYDPESEKFKRRSRSTTEPVPELNAEAIGILYQKITDNESTLDQTNFAKLYKQALHEAQGSLNPELLEKIEGEWKKFSQNSMKDTNKLVDSLQGKGTGWCTAGRATAESQLNRGDFYVFYSHDESGTATVPRVAIRMQDGRVAEMRGIMKNQNIEDVMLPIATEKLATLPGSEKFLKAQEDMQRVTEISRKTHAGEELSRDDLRFLYQIDHHITGFGYGTDPRIGELLSERNKQADYAIIYDVEIDQIATTYEELSDTTILYAGQFPVSRLGKQGFSKYPNLRHFTTPISLRGLRKARFTADDARWLIDRGFLNEVMAERGKLFIDVSHGDVVDIIAENPEEFAKQSDTVLWRLYSPTAEKPLEKRHFDLFLESDASLEKLLGKVHMFDGLDDQQAAQAIFTQAAKRGYPLDVQSVAFDKISPEAGKEIVHTLLSGGDIAGAIHVESSVADDQFKVFSNYIEKGFGAQVAEIAAKQFAYSINYGKNPEEVTQLVESLIADGHAATIVASLLRRHYGSRNSTTFPQDQLVDLLVKHDRTDLVLANADNFTTIHKRQIADIAKANLAKDSVERIVATLEAKRRVSQDHIQALLDEGKADVVLEHINQFSGLDKNDLLTKLLDTGYTDIVGQFGSKFNGAALRKETLKQLERHGMYRFIASNATNFEDTPQKEIIDILMANGQGSAVLEHLQHFKKLDNETTQILIDQYGLGLGQIQRHIGSFTLGDSVAELLINQGDAQYVIDNIGSFDLSPPMLAEAWRKAL